MTEQTPTFFDIETQYLFTEKNTKNPADLKIAVAGIKTNGKISLFEEHQTKELIKELQKAELIIGHNLYGFDYQVLQPYTNMDTILSFYTKTLDMMRDLAEKLGRKTKWVSLDDLGKQNCNIQKTENTLKIPEMWRNSKQDEVKAYLINDLKMTEQIYNYALINKKLRYEHFEYGISYGVKEVCVNW